MALPTMETISLPGSEYTFGEINVHKGPPAGWHSPPPPHTLVLFLRLRLLDHGGANVTCKLPAGW